jgi:protein gp37
MTGKSAIEWCDLTWNPLAGCTRVSPGCDHCYAFTLHDTRHHVFVENNGVWPKTGKPIPVQYAKPFTEIQLFPQRLSDPLKNKRPTKYFVNSMSDLFHSKVPLDYILECFEVMRKADWHIFQVLTKRGNRLQKLADVLNWPDNVWMGVSIENDKLTVRADQLRKVPARIRFLSCEPLLEPLPSLNLEGIDWVITGGESGPDARPCHPDWVRDIRDRCVAAGVAYLHKQWGGRTPKAGGRELDGKIWDEYPLVLRSA